MLTTKVDNVDNRIASVEKVQVEMASHLASVERGQLRLESRMESEVIDKIKALFDDREVQNERLDRIESKLDLVTSDTGYLMSKVVRLEALAK